MTCNPMRNRRTYTIVPHRIRPRSLKNSPVGCIHTPLVPESLLDKTLALARNDQEDHLSVGDKKAASNFRPNAVASITSLPDREQISECVACIPRLFETKPQIVVTPLEGILNQDSTSLKACARGMPPDNWSMYNESLNAQRTEGDFLHGQEKETQRGANHPET